MADEWLTARDAALRLQISLPTLYAYVSRGLIRSEPVAGRRERRYSAEDVDRLSRRKDRDASGALDFGQPVLDSAISLVDGGRLYFRGRDAMALARTASFEEVAGIVWGQDATAWFEAAPRAPSARVRAVVDALGPARPAERFLVAAAAAAVDDPAAWDLRPAAFGAAGARVLWLFASLAGASGDAAIAPSLAAGWGVPGHAAAISAALVACADHELNVSSFTARCVSSARSTAYHCVAAGLSALLGVRAGGEGERVEALLAEARSDPASTVQARLRRGERVPGFGHRLYPAGDPRARLLLEVAREIAPDPSVDQLVEAGRATLGEHPTVDVGLVALTRALGLPAGTCVTLFAIGRVTGWIGHALEQLALEPIIRPRARYAGPRPKEPSPSG